MALDEAMFLQHEAGLTAPTLRLYAWQSPTLSLGYAQQAQHEVDHLACQAHGVAIVRRPTGGRAVLHDQEVTYSIVMPMAAGSGTLHADYHAIALALAAALQAVGVPVHVVRPQARTAAARLPASPACFAALSRYELSVAGKKLVGSAQKRGQRAFLQHGAIPLEIDRSLLFHCLRLPDAERPRSIQDAYATMTAVNEVLPTPITPQVLHTALQHSFATMYGVPLVASPLLPQEVHLAQELYARKYRTAAWNLGGPTVWRQTAASLPDATAG